MTTRPQIEVHDSAILNTKLSRNHRLKGLDSYSEEKADSYHTLLPHHKTNIFSRFTVGEGDSYFSIFQVSTLRPPREALGWGAYSLASMTDMGRQPCSLAFAYSGLNYIATKPRRVGISKETGQEMTGWGARILHCTVTTHSTHVSIHPTMPRISDGGVQKQLVQSTLGSFKFQNP